MNLTRARTAYHWDHAIFTFFLVPVSSVLQVTHRLQRNRENERRLRRAWTLVPWVGWGKGEGRGWKRGVWGGIFLRNCIGFPRNSSASKLDNLRWALFGFAGRVSRFNFFFMGSCSLSLTIMFAFIRFTKVVDGSRKWKTQWNHAANRYMVFCTQIVALRSALMVAF